ncbi:hypothetical protein ACFL6M_06910 [Candidatus Eisenbacteria bacterium]|uniref:Uncharacterized protein n=1 Tax=Eiseniibacteriota bacterium TaxID=2212470 RepID=A0ABV6YLV5_UNCEI
MNSLPSSSSQYEEKASQFDGRGEIVQASSKSETEDPFLPRVADSASSDWPATENAINFARLREYRRELTTHFLGLVAECDFEYGFKSVVDTFLNERLAENGLATKEWLNDLFIRYWNDIAVVTGVLRAVAHLEYAEVCPQGPTMALASLSHGSVEVRECGIRAFENWASLDSLHLLQQVHCPEPWLQEYVDRVVTELKEGLGIDVSAGEED